MNNLMRTCSACLMDTTDPEISFDQDGVCNHCMDYQNKIMELNKTTITQKQDALKHLIKEMKIKGKGKKYDCVVGVSGGVDSSYVALLAKEYGLRALLVHLDNGWDSELSVKNIQNIVDYTGFDLHTLVIDWNEFKEIQRAFFKAHVIDLELISDHAIFASVFRLAKENRIKYILNGENFITEAIMPKSWNWPKYDATNIKSIYKKHGTGYRLKTFPFMSIVKRIVYTKVYGIKSIQILNYIDYNKSCAIKDLETEIGWRNYGGKHFESIFTRFYQGVILPTKFGVDKRKAHLSTLINAGQLSRNEAELILNEETYPNDFRNEDFEYVCKKLNFSTSELKSYLSQKPNKHSDYKSEIWVYDTLLNIKRFF